MALFESYERRINQVNAALNKYGIASLDEAKKICDDKGIDVYNLIKSIQPICFENACWAYITGTAIAIKKGCTKAKGPRYLELAEGYITKMALDADNQVIGYKFVHLGKMMEAIRKGADANEALEKATGQYGRFDDAVKVIDPREE